MIVVAKKRIDEMRHAILLILCAIFLAPVLIVVAPSPAVFSAKRKSDLYHSAY